jgi:tetratricopeptide (TPR) repeat protein
VTRGRTLGAYAGAAALAAIVLYGPTIGFGWTYDDPTVVALHPQVTGHRWAQMFSSPYHVGETVRVATGAYRPLTIASLAANHLLTGGDPWSYHLVNVLLHAAATVLVVFLAAELGLSAGGAFVAGLAFAVHPVHVEAVANVAGRAEPLAAALALSALLAYLRGRLAVLALLLGGAVFSKESAVTIAGVVLLWELLRPAAAGEEMLRSRLRRAAAPVAAALIPVALYLAARIAVLSRLGLAPGSVTMYENPIVGLSPIPHAATALAVFARAAALIVTPIRLSPDYGFAEIVPVPTLLAPEAIAGAALLAGAVAAVVLCRARAPRVSFLLASALATYAIVSNGVVIIGTVLGDRLLYLPSVFACLLLGLAAATLAARAGRAMAAGVVALLTLALAARAATYAAVWRDDPTLFAYAARVAPRSVRALGGFAESLAEQGRIDEARAVLERAVAIAPDFIPNRLNRGAAELMAGDLADAEADARHVLALEPGNAVALNLLASISRHAR